MMMSHIVSIGDAKAKLSELVRVAKEEDVVLVRHSRPAAVLVDYDRYEELLERLDDAEDALAAYTAPGDTVSLDELHDQLEVDRRTA